jgi:phage tail tape-measure protein
LTEMPSDSDDSPSIDLTPRYIAPAAAGVTESLSTSLRTIGRFTAPVALTIDAVRIGSAVHTDCTKRRKKRPGKRAAKATANVVGGWTGAGFGTWAGAAVGSLFGGVGAVPGAVIGGAIGSMIGSAGGSAAGGALVDEFVSSDSEDSD